ncbi:hypothetical protein C2846_03840 [Pseudomonas jilinensis]|uniref:Uncharacterized protein n=1 Tax=Pseudomonas jilinensis TaxID=2078689 RepID=A0A396S093_9PSED|nr:hypothetical protein C2846_03840 [Pseudomonas jilinensis]
MEFILSFLMEVFFYGIGYWFLKAVTLGRFSDKKVSLYVSLVGVAVFVAVVLVLYFIIWR